MKIVFMGTPNIAEAALKALLRDGHEVLAVYTREDKPVGRKQVITPPPVKLCAAENRIEVRQPKTLRDNAEELEYLAELAPDVIVVVAYGMMLPGEILRLPRYGCVNLHVSMLPAYRGAAPIQWAVINGEEKTGVTVMLMDEGMDTGPVLAAREIEIGPDATAGDVFDVATTIGARLLAETLPKLEEGLQAVPQQGEASMAPRLTKQMGEVDFARPAAQLHNLVRGCNPWPLAWFTAGGKKLKVQRAKPSRIQGGAPGEVLSLKPLTVACGERALELLEVVPEGARMMTGSEWAAGRRLKVGDTLG